MRTLVVAGLLLTGLLALPLAAALPPCTCDPNPVVERLKCLTTDGTSPPPGCPDPLGEILSPIEPAPPELGPLDPRSWPCTCDPIT